MEGVAAVQASASGGVRAAGEQPQAATVRRSSTPRVSSAKQKTRDAKKQVSCEVSSGITALRAQSTKQHAAADAVATPYMRQRPEEVSKHTIVRVAFRCDVAFVASNLVFLNTTTCCATCGGQ